MSDDDGATAGRPRKSEMFGRLGLPVLVVGGVLVLSLSVAVVTLAMEGPSSQAVSTTTSTSSVHRPTVTPADHHTTATIPSVPTTAPPSPTTTTGYSEATYADSVDGVCEQFVPHLTALVTTGIDGGIFNESEVKTLVSQMLSDISAIPAPPGEASFVNGWIVDWKDSWSAALSENTRLFTSDIRTADMAARLIGLSSECM